MGLPFGWSVRSTSAGATERAEGEWTERARLPALQSDAAGGVVDGTLYYFGGFPTGAGVQPLDRAQAYDPAVGENGEWRRIEDVPRAVWGACGVAADEKLFSFGGAPGNPYDGTAPSDEVFRYVPGEGWTDLTDEADVRCPYPNWAMRGAYDPDDELIYCVGGGTDVTDRASATAQAGTDQPGTFDESRLWTFDPDAEAVADPDLARMPEAKRWPSVALVAVDDRPCLHVIAGRYGGGGPTDSNYRYDIERGEWSEMTSAPLSGNYGSNSDPVLDNAVYLTQGISLEGDLSMDSYRPFSHRYDPDSDAFETDIPSPSYPRTGPVDAVIDGTLYVVGGHRKRYDRNDEHEALPYNEAFTPGSDSW
jgi:hypothetical protein